MRGVDNVLLFLVAAALSSVDAKIYPLPAAFIAPTVGWNHQRQHKMTQLSASSNYNPEPKKEEKTTTTMTKKKQKPSGVYARPSAAIERGSGFFVPGLEGSKVRNFFAVGILILSYANHNLGGDLMITNEISSSLATSESVATVLSLILLLSGVIEFGREVWFQQDRNNEDFALETNTGMGLGASDSVSRQMMEECGSTTDLTSDSLDVCRWVAATLISLTPATTVFLVQSNNDNDDANGENIQSKVLYGLGRRGSALDDSKGTDWIRSAVQTAHASTGGRVSVPSDHLSAVAIRPESNRRCVLLQRIDDSKSDNPKICLMIGSDQLLQAFGKNDLRWIGRLSKHLGDKILS